MNYRTVFSALAVLLLVIAFISCSETPPTKTDTESPSAPTLLGPVDNGSDVALDQALVWQCSDPNGDALTYALYFGETKPPPLLIDKLTDTVYVVKDIEPGKTYYWKVVATDPDGHSTDSRVMTFATTNSFQYPLEVGNRWGYDWTVDQDSVSGVATSMTAQYEATVQVEADTTLFGSLPAVVLLEQRFWDGSNDESRLYSANTADGMFTYAYTTGGSIAPGKAATGVTYTVNGRVFNSPSDLSLALGSFGQYAARSANAFYEEDPPVQVLAYPLEEGSHWTYRTAGNPWKIDRRVVGYEQIETAAGKFHAFKVEWLFDVDNDGVWDDNVSMMDWISKDGLVKRAQDVSGVEVSDEHGLPVGVIDFHETFELRDIGGN